MDKLDRIIKESLSRVLNETFTEVKDKKRSSELSKKATKVARENGKKAAAEREAELTKKVGRKNSSGSSRQKAKKIAKSDTTNLTAIAREMQADGIGTQYKTANSFASALRKEVYGKPGASGGRFKLHKNYADGIIHAEDE